MKRSVAAICAAMLLFTGVVTAHADTGTLGGGTSVTTTLTSPADGAMYVAGTDIPVSGTVDVGEGVAAKNTDLVFVLDTSKSTASKSKGWCTNTILACEKDAVSKVTNDVSDPLSPVAKVGVVGFPSTHSVSLQPVPLAKPLDLTKFKSSGNTAFDVGITRARDMLKAPSDASKDLIVLFTDGNGTYKSVKDINKIVIKAFTIGGAGCTGPLVTAVKAGATGSECVKVTKLDDLAGVVAKTIAPSLDRVDITVNGAVVQQLNVTAQGPSTTPFSTTLTGLAAGPDVEICAVAHVTDSGGSGVVSDCSTVDILPAGTVIVDCAAADGNCVGTATDPGRSSLTFEAPPEFDETVTIAPDLGGPGACGGVACTTGYFVGFETNDPNGPIASITVTTAQKVSLKDRLNAAVYIDDVRITKQCNNRVLIAKLRNLFGVAEPIPCITIMYLSDGRLEYFVKFNADPAVRFR